MESVDLLVVPGVMHRHRLTRGTGRIRVGWRRTHRIGFIGGIWTLGGVFELSISSGGIEVSVAVSGDSRRGRRFLGR